MFNTPDSSEESQESAQKQHLFVDEAGDPTIFNGKGEINIGELGCSRYFMLGKLEVDDPPALASRLNQLRMELIAHPYFAGVESFKAERKKTALLFHAKDDLPEVRFRVFELLREMGNALRFHAVVCDKLKIAEREQAKRSVQPGYRYNPNSLYDDLTESLFSKFHRLADGYELCVAKRGNKDRNQALRQALERAERTFEHTYGFSRGGIKVWSVTISNPETVTCLQAVDYFLWAVQRFYEARMNAQTGEILREDRYLNLLWPQIGEIHDLHIGPEYGTFFNHTNPLTLEKRFPPPRQSRKTK
jgi:hypothetical protein